MLKRIPNREDLSRVYFELAKIGAKSVGENNKWPYSEMDQYDLLSLAAEMSRYDPRLLGILVEFFISHWEEINPTKLKSRFPFMKNPQVFGVIGEFMKSALPDQEIFDYVTYLTAGLKPLPTQFFFHGLYDIGGTLSQKTVEANLVEYKRWGFLGRERPTIDFQTKKTVGTLDKNGRLNILRTLLNKRNIITISDYLKAVDHSISRQQALTDLKKAKFTRKIGKGRGTRWKFAA